MALERLLSHWKADSTISTNITAWHVIPERCARFVPLPDQLHPALAHALKNTGIHSLYTHQAATYELIKEGHHVAIVTGTASGKTLCYNLPILDYLLKESKACALYLFPTKALAQDQSASLKTLVDNITTELPRLTQGGVTISPAIYDGDTPSSHRQAIRAKTRLLLTNPDMLHMGILPHHTQWVDFLRNLRFVVIDEMHLYRGVFGSHFANLIRRLKRIAGFYGARIQFILTSATIANPQELAEKLVEETVLCVDDDGSARGRQTVLLYNPPIIHQDIGLRRSASDEAIRLVEDLLAYDVQSIIFSQSRRGVELILTYLREREGGKTSEAIIRGYRAGYLPGERRAIERGLRKGEVRVVIATNALELGIDIGKMGASLMVGYPGTIATTWQQAGRAGRGEEPSLAVLIASANPLDQFLVSHPDYLFQRSPEHALVNPDNLLILLDHLRCAVFELPFQMGDTFGRVNPESVSELLNVLYDQGVLHPSKGKYFWMADQYPAQNISLRNISTAPVILQVVNREHPQVIGQVDYASAHWMVHPQAIYLHEGQMYLVKELDLQENIAWLIPTEVDYYTEPRLQTSIEVLDTMGEQVVSGGVKTYGELKVTIQVIGFRKVQWYTHVQLGIEILDLPPTELLTTGYWLALSEGTVTRLRDQDLWSNDPNEYGPNWRAQRDRARARDGYRCQVCDLPEQGRMHDVHHKIPFRVFQSYEQANQLDNLITLCSACHRRVEAVVRIHSGLAGLAFVLGHLSPLFLMCDARDLGVHTDPQGLISRGSPAVVLYEHVPAGIGFSQTLFEVHDELIRQAYELVKGCGCSDGCPSCVGPGGEGGMGSKHETLAILAALNSDKIT